MQVTFFVKKCNTPIAVQLCIVVVYHPILNSNEESSIHICFNEGFYICWLQISLKLFDTLGDAFCDIHIMTRPSTIYWRGDAALFKRLTNALAGGPTGFQCSTLFLKICNTICFRFPVMYMQWHLCLCLLQFFVLIGFLVPFSAVRTVSEKQVIFYQFHVHVYRLSYSISNNFRTHLLLTLWTSEVAQKNFVDIPWSFLLLRFSCHLSPELMPIRCNLSFCDLFHSLMPYKILDQSYGGWFFESLGQENCGSFFHVKRIPVAFLTSKYFGIRWLSNFSDICWLTRSNRSCKTFSCLIYDWLDSPLGTQH